MYYNPTSEITITPDCSFVPVIHKRSEVKGEGIFVARSLINDNGKISVGDPRIIPNRVVITGRNYYARITAGVIQKFINNMKLGTDPTPAVDGDTDLRSVVWPAAGQTGAFESYNFPADGQVTFIKKITGNEFGQEYQITEMGAFFNDGVMLDRSITSPLPVHPTNVDNVEVGLIIEWSIIF